MYALIGYQTTYTPNPFGKADPEETKRIVALFTTKEKAQDYIDNSRLKNPKKGIWDEGRPFKRASLLSHFAYAEIEEFNEEDWPVDPEL